MKWLVSLTLFNFLIASINCDIVKVVECVREGDQDRWYTTEGGQHCYTVVNNLEIYKDAEQYCMGEAGHLVSVHSDQELEVIRSVFQEAGFYSEKMLWLGLHRNQEAGEKERWSDGTYVDYARWSAVQDDRLEHCAYIKLKAAVKEQDGQWFRSNCGAKRPYICKRVKNGSSITPTPKPEPITGQCEEGWIRRNNTCYKVNKEELAFEDASNFCRKKYSGANLVAILSEQSQNFVSSLAGETDAQYIWLGGYKLRNGFQYVWKTNDPFDTYDNWAPGSPGYDYSGTNCVKMALKSHHSAGQWEESNCDTKLPFICQKSINPKISQPSSAVFPKTCPNHEGYFQYRNACFKIHDSNNNWKEAEDLCKAETGHLASYADRLELGVVMDSMQSRNLSELWIGIRGIKHEHESFSWTDGTPLYFTNWGEFGKVPANVTQCVYQNSDGAWIATTACETKRNFICKLYLNEKPEERPTEVLKQCPALNLTDDEGEARHWIDLDPKLDYCYEVQETVEQFGSAQFNCYILGGVLPSIHTEHEMKLLSNLVSKLQYNRGIWIGLHRKNNGGFQWVDETPVDLFRWVEGEPSNDTDLACVQADNSFDNWKVRSCLYTHANYVCAIKKIVTSPPEQQKDSSSHFLKYLVIITLSLITIFAIGSFSYYGYKYSLKRSGATNDDIGPVVNFGYLNENLREGV